jgi:transcriptional regulator with XRE-family HTH domain
MSADWFKLRLVAWRARMGFTQKAGAQALKVSLRTLQGWEAAGRVPHQSNLVLLEMDRIENPVKEPDMSPPRRRNKGPFGPL